MQNNDLDATIIKEVIFMVKVLIIEDDESLYRMYSTEMGLSGFKVVWHNKGNGVVDKAKTENPNIILLDIILPDKDGLHILKELKSDPLTKKVPVIMLTNFGSDANVREALENGAEDFLLKYKIVPAEIVQKIRDILKV
ncbi:response regulator [candidate division WWE3 bacterium CG08_land_8_20_14_0_20_40_13]|uniref:Response regulator n=1 Tax=candidate division WWE3 bacterium CG08_land_8_20_14_0_20_40_13 TaxID=1975084 RepID=A0A2H0XDH8_UNCKA|nr:MAG: response regulator [candidate division WWE3 bacterium CG08_land_8_20_14_0_20_40_13]